MKAKDNGKWGGKMILQASMKRSLFKAVKIIHNEISSPKHQTRYLSKRVNMNSLGLAILPTARMR